MRRKDFRKEERIREIVRERGEGTNGGPRGRAAASPIAQDAQRETDAPYQANQGALGEPSGSDRGGGRLFPSIGDRPVA